MALYEHPIQLGKVGMKILRFPLVKLVIGAALLIAGLSLSNWLNSLLPNSSIQAYSFNYWLNILADILLPCGISVMGYWFFVSLFEGRPSTEISKGILKNTGMGLILGFGFISLIIAIMALLGYYSILGNNPQTDLVSVFVMAVTAGIVEEIGLRAYFFRIIEEALGTWWSVVLSALLFGFLHMGNPNATIISSLSIALTAGVVLALLFAITRNLWIVIAMHFAWNFTLGGIYNAPVSGMQTQGIFSVQIEGPEILTGGAFGPEASLITMLVFCLFGVYLVVRTIRAKQVLQPMWKRKNDTNQKS